MSRASSRLIVASVLGFALLEVVAMRLYPGGTFWDRSTTGARFWQNFLCDLASQVALDGRPNALGARFGQSAIWLMMCGLAPFWWILPGQFARLPRLGRFVRALGLSSLGGILAVSLLPSSRFGAWHGTAVIMAGAPGLSAAGLAVAGLAYTEPPPAIGAVLGGATLAFALVDFVLYARSMLTGGPGPILLPIVQKIAVLLLATWMLVTARSMAR